MKSKLVYFVLYLVVIAELLVVIYERDLLVNELKFKADLAKYIQEVEMDTLVNNEKFSVPMNPGSVYNVVQVRGISTDEEKAALVFYGERVSQVGDLPTQINSNETGNQFIRLEKSKDIALLKFTSDWRTLPGVIKGGSRGTGYRLQYNVYLKTPRILPRDLEISTVAKILSGIAQIKGKEHIRLSYVFNLPDSVLLNVIKKVDEASVIGLNESELSELKSSIGNINDVKDSKQLATLAAKYKDMPKIKELRQKFEMFTTKKVLLTLIITE